MANTCKQLLRFLSVFLLVLFKGVTSNVDDGAFDESGFRRFDEHYSSFQDQFSDFYDETSHPIENHLWQSPKNLGEISGVAVDPSGKVMIFHRGDRSWNYNTFDENAEYREKYLGPITDNTVLTLDPNTGGIIRGWGNQTFYLPHGIHVDVFGNVWLTDVALHQVFKYSSSGVPQMILGEKFVPGNDMAHFCQPTSIAIAPAGEIVVADGYCNSRIVVFDSTGNPKYSVGELWINLRIPHSLTILPNKELCIADRENFRIVCLDIGLAESKQNLEPPYSIRHRQLGRIFGITSYRDIIYAVNGMTSRKLQAKGFTINSTSKRVTGFWGPDSSSFVRPHSIAVCPNGTALYVSEVGPNKVWKFDLIQNELM